MEKLIVLDHTTNRVHVYNLDREEFISEEYIQDLGFDTGNCNWMAGDLELIYHKGILT